MLDERRRQAALDELGILDTPPDERIDRVTRLAKEMFGVPMVGVTLIDRDRQWTKSEIGLGTSEVPREDSFCNITVEQDRQLVVTDASTTDPFSTNPFVTGDAHVRFYAGHPLHAPGGEPVGALCIVDTEPRELTEDQQVLLGELAFWVQSELARDRERDDAVAIQHALQPRLLPKLGGYTLAAGAAAQNQISGDFYDLSMVNGALRFSLADAMGKGTGPAIVSATLRGSLRTAPHRPLMQLMTDADRLFDEDFGDAPTFVTAILGELQPETGRLELIDAGHGLAFVLRADGSWLPLSSTGLPLGMGMGAREEREVATAQLAPGDTLVCCSDGLLDVLDEDDPFGHVGRVLATLGPDGAVAEALKLARGDRATDDTTVIVVRRDG